MNGLLCIPDKRLSTDLELYDITSYLNTTVLAGKDIDTRKIVDSLTRSKEVVIIASHMNSKEIALSGENKLDSAALLMICELAKTKLLLLNGCESSRLANYVILNSTTVTHCIHTTVELKDSEAWKFPLSYFRILESMGNDFSKTFYQIKHNFNTAHYGLYTKN